MNQRETDTQRDRKERQRDRDRERDRVRAAELGGWRGRGRWIREHTVSGERDVVT